jgi:hypothetical protein
MTYDKKAKTTLKVILCLGPGIEDIEQGFSHIYFSGRVIDQYLPGVALQHCPGKIVQKSRISFLGA